MLGRGPILWAILLNSTPTEMVSINSVIMQQRTNLPEGRLSSRVDDVRSQYILLLGHMFARTKVKPTQNST